MRETESQNRPLPGAVAFGATVGVLHGAAAGLVCCWLAQAETYYLPAAAVGATIGGMIGALVGALRGKERNGKIDPDVGMWSGVCCGMIPAILIFVAIGVGFGKPGIGAMFICPMVALLTGGICDRIYESRLRNEN